MPQSAKSFGRGQGPRTRHQRGYDNDWLRLRAAHLDGNPLCVRCESRGIIRLATTVDHIKPFRGLNDPRRLDPANLASLCFACHTEKTREDQK
jgi:5-methylcytosine-specific restriction protein A